MSTQHQLSWKQPTNGNVASEGVHLAVVDQLLERGADVSAALAEWGGRTALQAASEDGHLAVVDRLLERPPCSGIPTFGVGC